MPSTAEQWIIKEKTLCAENDVRILMDKTINVLVDQLTGIHYGVISPGVIDTVRVDCYNQKMPIKCIAQTSCDQNRVSVTPYDTTLLGSIDKALKQAGFNSYIFSKTQVVVTFSTLSGAEREKVKDHIRKLAEDARVAIRNCRKKARQAHEKDFKYRRVSNDTTEKFEKSLQQLTDQKIEEIDGILTRKLAAL